MWVLNLTKLRIETQKYGKVDIKYDHNTTITMYTTKYKEAEGNNFPSRQLVNVTWLLFCKKGDKQHSISK